MKLSKLSIAALMALSASTSMMADGGIELYEDITTKQIFTSPGENRQKLGNFIQENNLAEAMKKELKGVQVKSKAKSIEFSGTHYLGYQMDSYRSPLTLNSNGQSTRGGFEFRRNYVQAKAYFNDKDFLRVTIDSTKELGQQNLLTQKTDGTAGGGNGQAMTYIKYAYLWLDNVLPYTGVEMGVTHRAWIDYEENNAWYYRSINKVALEDKYSAQSNLPNTNTITVKDAKGNSQAYNGGKNGVDSPDVMNSADLGVNFRTTTDYVTSEVALFNGEGYHADKLGSNQRTDTGLSFEGRVTAHLLGNGKHAGHYDIEKESYANISGAWLLSKNHKDDNVLKGDTKEYDRSAYWVHGVYNHPMFLVAGQYGWVNDKYIHAANTNGDKNNKLWSINGEIRPIKDWTILARYDSFDYKQKVDSAVYGLNGNADSTVNKAYDATMFVYGVAYKYNKNVKFIASGKTVDAKLLDKVGDYQAWLLTAEVTW